MSFRTGLCALVLIGCKREPDRVVPPAASAAPVPVAASSAQAPASSASAPDPLVRASAVVSAWDAALNRHDAAALAPLYAASVSFYGRTMTRDALLDSKRRALAATPNYSQSLSNLRLANDADGGVKATFTKRSGANDAQREVGASLRLQPVGAGFLIASESDAPTDARSDENKTCMEVAMDVVNALPQVTSFFKTAPADARPGGVTYTEEPTRGSAAIGFHHDDRFEAIFFIDVDAGKLGVNQYSEPLTVPTAAQARVRAKCSPH